MSENIPHNEIEQSLLDNVYDDFVESVLNDGHSIVINYIKTDASGVNEENYVVSKDIVARLDKIIKNDNSDILTLLEKLVRTVKVQITADGNLISINRPYDIRFFVIDKIIEEPQGPTKFRLILIESDKLNYFNQEVTNDPELHLDDVEEVMNQDEVSYLVNKLLEGNKEVDLSEVKELEKPDKTLDKTDLLELKIAECNMLKSRLTDLKKQLKRQDTLYQKLYNKINR
ncbi:MAG: hypothetical protein COB02_10365 [Candidatus Cloacimonadota bacterium]|nr:MAG: hypothetical protein COB02_10365 [Candidatus Cloacimonadota bacterium]